MKIKCLVCAAMAIGLILVAGCATPNTGDKPWDKPVPEDNNPSYNSPNFSGFQ